MCVRCMLSGNACVSKRENKLSLLLFFCVILRCHLEENVMCQYFPNIESPNFNIFFFCKRFFSAGSKDKKCKYFKKMVEIGRNCRINNLYLFWWAYR